MHNRSLIVAGAAVLAVSGPAAQPLLAAEASLDGTFALPGVAGKIAAELVVRETGPLARELVITFTDKATGQPVTQFEEELAQKLHLLATDSDFSSFIHEHPGEPGPDGRFRIELRFPKAGLYHIYADTMPLGLGQQVVRFDLPVSIAAAPSSAAGLPAPENVTKGSDGPYSVRLDASALRAGTESMMALTISKDGKPAKDLGLYLGVAAHAVFVSTDDLGYVHAHAMGAKAPDGGHHAHGAHHAPGASVPADLMLHATPPRPGRYALWIQFSGGGQIRTVPFFVTVPAGSAPVGAERSSAH